MPQELPQQPALRNLTSAQQAGAQSINVASQMNAQQQARLMQDFQSVAMGQVGGPSSIKPNGGCVGCSQESAAPGQQKGFGQPSVRRVPTQIGRVSNGFLLGEGRLQVLGGPASPAVHGMNGSSVGLNDYMLFMEPAPPGVAMKLGDWPCTPAHVVSLFEKLGSESPGIRKEAREELLDLLEICPDLVSQLGERAIGDRGDSTTGEPGTDPETRAALQEILDVLQVDLEDVRQLVLEIGFLDFTKAQDIADLLAKLDIAISLSDGCGEPLQEIRQAINDRKDGFITPQAYQVAVAKQWKKYEDCVKAVKAAKAARRKRLGLSR